MPQPGSKINLSIKNRQKICCYPLEA